MDNHILCLHLGTQKTGTSSLQAFLFNNRDNLLKQGWDYPTFEETSSNYSLNIKNGIPIWSAFLEKDNALFDECMSCILNHLKKNNVIVSCEDIWPMKDMLNVVSKIQQYYKNVKVIVYIRRQDHYIESLYNQFVKGPRHETMEITQFVEYAEEMKIARYLDNLVALRKIFGDNLIVRRFEKEAFQGERKDLISDFLTVLKIEEKSANWFFPKNRNESLGSRLLEIKRIINSVIKNTHEFYKKYDELINQLNTTNVKLGFKDCYKILSPELRQKILQAHEAENIEIARLFFEIKDGGVFQDKNINIPYEKCNFSSEQEELIKIFASTTIRQEINLAFLHSRQNKRKLAYFGAGTICRDFLKKNLYSPDVIIDNYTQNTEVEGIPVISAESIKNWKDYHIIITCAAYNEIEIQLHQKRLREGNDYIKWFDISTDGSPYVDIFMLYRLMSLHPYYNVKN